MNTAIATAAIVAGLMLLFIGDLPSIRPSAPPAAKCRAPIAEGDVTLITIDVRDGTLFVDCQYATTRPSKPKHKGG